jgi:DNA uptake protein ComE-like DNA-binding protein
VSRVRRRRYWKSLLRQIWWTAMPVWSFGLLSFAPFLRLALERRRRTDWAITGAYLAAATAVLASFPFSGTVAVVSTAFGLCLAFFAAVHAAVAFRPARDDVLSSAEEDQRAVEAAGQDHGVLEAAANERAMEAARGRIARRAAAARLARADPLLARELKIGRPDLPREYDDGGMVDVNHVPGAVLEAHLGLTPEEIASLLSARDHLGAFSSLDELSAYGGLKPDRVDEFRDRIMLG